MGSADEIISTLEQLGTSRRIIVPSPFLLKQKLEGVLALGSKCLQVISDFDHTLSKHTDNDNKVPVCHGMHHLSKNENLGVFCSLKCFPDHGKMQLRELTSFYIPIENNPDISDAEKMPYMLEFWNLVHKVISDTHLSRAEFDSSLGEWGIVLRQNCLTFLHKLKDHDIPLLIFSGGIGNVIELILKNLDVSLENIRVVSNFMDFDGDGLLIGFQEPVIHCLNKTLRIIQNSDYYDTVLSKRHAILLIGDSLGDAHMVNDKWKFNGEPVIVIRIGFLNLKIEENMEKFKTLYDIILIQDETFDIPIQILNFILSGK